MADKHQSKQDANRKHARGAGQAVVSLCRVTESGLIFSSRHRFDLAAELQVRVRSEVLPHLLRACLKSDAGGWVTVRGFVVECHAVRKSDGAAEFRVSVVLDAALISAARRSAGHPPLGGEGRIGQLFGLN